MPMRLGVMAYPAALIIMAISAKGGNVPRLVEARAFAPDTARRPESVGIKGGAQTLAGAVRKGIVIDNGDGRFYVDMIAFRRRQKRMVSLFVTVAVLGAALVALLLIAPWKG